MRYCFITEEQLEYILKEGDCYLDKTDTGSDAPIDSCKFNGGETTVKKADSDEIITTDKIAHSRVSGHPWLRRSYGLSEDLDDEISARIAKNTYHKWAGKWQTTSPKKCKKEALA